MNTTIDSTVLTSSVPVVVVPVRSEKSLSSTSTIVAPDRVDPEPIEATHETAVPSLRDTVTIWNVPFDRLGITQSVDAIGKLVRSARPSYVITANLNYCMLHARDATVRQITHDADLILADGQPIVWRSLLGHTPLPERVAGSEMIFDLCERAAEEGWRVYLLGGADGVANSCAYRLQEKFPGLVVAGTHCPPFRKLSKQEQAEQLAMIRNAKPDLLLVAFGQPKGEKWIHQNRHSLGPICSIQLGASFDFIAGTATRAPEIYQRTGMEWAYRMFSDPSRLIPRYASNAWFLAKALLGDWQQTVKRWGVSP